MAAHRTRRDFLKRSSSLTTLGAVAPWAWNLAAIRDAAAQTAPADYKALVCIYLSGGNDQHNTLVPFDPGSHDAYRRIRGNIAITRTEALEAMELRPANPWPAGRSLALNPKLAPLLPLFNGGKLALVLNVGTLLGPMTLADYGRRSGVPPKLFSHNDQTLQWHRGPGTSATGYGGRLADILQQGQSDNSVFGTIATTGGSFLNGANGSAYRIDIGGPTVLEPVANDAFLTETLQRIITASSPHLLQQAYADETRSALNASVRVATALKAVPDPTTIPATSLGLQLRIVARLMAARAALGMRRQVFHVTLHGFDTHAGMPLAHDALLGELADAMAAFHATTVSMGLGDKVTTFTASDFGRTLSSNGDGTDHGWGSYQFVMGDAVRGRRWVGQVPTIAVSGPDDVGSGRLLPALAVDQYMATLATWFGLPRSMLLDVVPRIGRYDQADLGFMRA